MTIQEFKTKLKSNTSEIAFAETMQVIEDNYNFTPTAFTNGEIENKAGENSGSCKLFAFAKLENLTEDETLTCFGEHYKNVLEDENGNSHQNIRNFMKTGFKGLSFDGEALVLI
ncbi:HopJ type III effector protein [Polaribacter sargassicola]|uniref:HopJ type III effector protein n=1 Tax=Polaribacter sargassicola TaxID=2836891 RepID=UPI001F45A381|nr:HopJ type III effector protein [Polaribacter sp. DS7-9]MCG1037353.1 HopJ type III effector protein [Polaribacter sp. DS7-9]